MGRGIGVGVAVAVAAAAAATVPAAAAAISIITIIISSRSITEINHQLLLAQSNNLKRLEAHAARPLAVLRLEPRQRFTFHT